LQTSPTDTCCFFFLCHPRFPLCSAPATAAHHRRRTPSSTSSCYTCPRVASYLFHLCSPPSLASPALATRAPPPLGRHRAVAMASSKPSARSSCLCALEHYNYPVELLVASFSSFSTPTSQNAATTSTRTPASSSSPSPHLPTAAPPALTPVSATHHPRAAPRPFLFPRSDTGAPPRRFSPAAALGLTVGSAIRASPHPHDPLASTTSPPRSSTATSWHL
jgi:hypothetical protein